MQYIYRKKIDFINVINFNQWQKKKKTTEEFLDLIQKYLTFFCLALINKSHQQIYVYISQQTIITLIEIFIFVHAYIDTMCVLPVERERKREKETKNQYYFKISLIINNKKKMIMKNKSFIT